MRPVIITLTMMYSLRNMLSVSEERQWIKKLLAGKKGTKLVPAAAHCIFLCASHHITLIDASTFLYNQNQRERARENGTGTRTHTARFLCTFLFFQTLQFFFLVKNKGIRKKGLSKRNTLGGWIWLLKYVFFLLRWALLLYPKTKQR